MKIDSFNRAMELQAKIKTLNELLEDEIGEGGPIVNTFGSKGMEKKEAIRAMLEGKKVRCKTWSGSAWLVYCDEEEGFVDELGILKEMNDYSNDSIWELYEEPKPKTKYYRRKWVKRSNENAVTKPHLYYETKEKFDSRYRDLSYDLMSDEWEEISI